jgi:hypothetical protein
VAPSHVSFTLQGCRNNGSIPAGTLVCPDAAYTTGNLGKGWNELDLVPMRITASAGNSAPSTQTYTVAAVLDNCIKSGSSTGFVCADGSSGFPGYDVITVPTISGSGCSMVVGSQSFAAPGVGGTDVSIYRLLTITQPQGSSCRIDFDGRLALGSHLFPGSSLHFNLTDENLATAGIGARDVSIPVNEILPQQLSKNMSASQGFGFSWLLTKSASPASVNFGNTCANNAASQDSGVSITITWTKSAPLPNGDISIATSISATNPANRTIRVTPTDTIYKDSTQTTQVDQITGPFVDVPANSTVQVLTHSVTVAAGGPLSDTSYNDVATATYIDVLTGVPVPGTTSATASASVVASGDGANDAVTINDTESITGSGLTFKVAAPSVGSFSGYTAGTSTTGPVSWSTTTDTSGSVTFNKTVTVPGATITNGTLSDSAQIVGDGGVILAGDVGSPVVASTSIGSGALVSLEIDKSYVGPSNATAQTFLFDITGPNNYSNVGQGVTIPGNGSSGSVTLNNLDPGTYNVSEEQPAFFAPVQGPFSPAINPDPNVGAASCSGAVSFTNTLNPASATATKSVVGTGATAAGWNITLSGSNGSQTRTTDSSGNLTSLFTLALLDGVTYTISEDPNSLPNYDPTSAVGGGGASSNTTQCTFTVHYPANAGNVFSCAFTNTLRGKVRVIKTENGASPTTVYSFLLTGGPDNVSIPKDTSSGGTLDFGYLKPGTYQLCEVNVPAGTTPVLSTAGYALVHTFPQPPTGDQYCIDVAPASGATEFPLSAGAVLTFTIDDTHPLGGQRTIGYWKNWNTCSGSNGNQVKTAAKTGHALVDDFVGSASDGKYILLGYYKVDTCLQAYNVLNNSSTKYAENGLAAQLLAAKLNVLAANGNVCPAAANAITTGDNLLKQISYAGPPSSKVGSNSPLRSQFTSVTNTLDQFNNELIC